MRASNGAPFDQVMLHVLTDATVAGPFGWGSAGSFARGAADFGEGLSGRLVWPPSGEKRARAAIPVQSRAGGGRGASLVETVERLVEGGNSGEKHPRANH